MKTHLVHPVSALATATVILGACLLSGMQQPAGEKQDILRHMTIVYLDDGQGGTAKTIRFTGVNVQVVNGLESTNGFPFDPDSVDPLDTVVNSVGNLIVGYNELGNPRWIGDDRTGSHNIVVGHGNNYTSFGGWVGPLDNMTSAPFASVTGGQENTSSGLGASVSGGIRNTAGGKYSSVSGGYWNYASGKFSSASGGYSNSARGDLSSVSGGLFNSAYSYISSVSGGLRNTAYGLGSSVSGGKYNIARGFYSSVSGGTSNVAYGDESSVSGGKGNGAFGESSSVSGGSNRSVSGTYNWRGGKYYSNN